MSDQDDLTFSHIPTLKDLLPRTSGTPGVHYAQVCTHNAMAAQREGWHNLANAAFYRIQGPKGYADMVLMKKGKPIVGASIHDGARRCFIDSDVEKLTGFESTPVKESTDGQVHVSQSPGSV